jgi:glycosyltransferase involved in cell wall biosynthesis
VVFPSLYEGFGLPVLEAMALGTPVITSNTSSLPEVAGDAALLVDPLDTRAIARAMLALDTDDAAVADMARAGLAQAEHFSAHAYRTRLAQFYTDLFGTAPLPSVSEADTPALPAANPAAPPTARAA